MQPPGGAGRKDVGQNDAAAFNVVSFPFDSVSPQPLTRTPHDESLLPCSMGGGGGL